MASDPVRAANANEWLALAGEDLANSRYDLAAPEPFLRSALFHCQQAVEKAFKAFLTCHDVVFRKVHDLEELGDQCAQVDSSMVVLIDRAAELSVYATRFRYPGAPYAPTIEEAQEAIATAAAVVSEIAERLNKTA